MFTRSLAAAVVLAALFTLPAAHADDTKAGSSDPMREIFYAGIGVQRWDTDFNNVGAPINLDAVMGIRIPTIDWIMAEIDVSGTIIPGKNDNQGGGILGKADCIGGVPGVPPGCTIPDDGGGNGDDGGEETSSQEDLQMLTLGVYAVLRSPGRFYATGKVGYRYLQTNFEELYDKRSGPAFGGGIGWRWGETLSGVEFLYTSYGDGVNSMGLHVVYGFGGGR
jgi:hypothetical protein